MKVVTRRHGGAATRHGYKNMPWLKGNSLRRRISVSLGSLLHASFILLAVFLAILTSGLVNSSVFANDGGSAAGTIITARSEATYVDDAGQSYTIFSETITITIATISALTVTPHDT